MTRPRLAVPAALLIVLLAGCASSAAGSPPASVSSATATTTETSMAAPTETPTETSTHGKWSDGGDQGQPAPFEVRYGDDALVLYAHTFCAEAVCADGFDDNPPSIGSPAQIYVRVPADRYSELTVSQVAGAADDPDPGFEVEADTAPVGDGWWVVIPRGPADSYRVTLFARGEGDMVADLLWETR